MGFNSGFKGLSLIYTSTYIGQIWFNKTCSANFSRPLIYSFIKIRSVLEVNVWTDVRRRHVR